MRASSDEAFFNACRKAGVAVGIGSGLVTLAVRQVFEAGVTHGLLRHMNGLWEQANAHETLVRSLVNSGVSKSDPDVQALLAEASTIRLRINILRGELPKC